MDGVRPRVLEKWNQTNSTSAVLLRSASHGPHHPTLPPTDNSHTSNPHTPLRLKLSHSLHSENTSRRLQWIKVERCPQWQWSDLIDLQLPGYPHPLPNHSPTHHHSHHTHARLHTEGNGHNKHNKLYLPWYKFTQHRFPFSDYVKITEFQSRIIPKEVSTIGDFNLAGKESIWLKKISYLQ